MQIPLIISFRLSADNDAVNVTTKLKVVTHYIPNHMASARHNEFPTLDIARKLTVDDDVIDQIVERYHEGILQFNSF
jgi:hypothetical protein